MEHKPPSTSIICHGNKFHFQGVQNKKNDIVKKRLNLNANRSCSHNLIFIHVKKYIF